MRFENLSKCRLVICQKVTPPNDLLKASAFAQEPGKPNEQKPNQDHLVCNEKLSSFKHPTSSSSEAPAIYDASINGTAADSVVEISSIMISRAEFTSHRHSVC